MSDLYEKLEGCETGESRIYVLEGVEVQLKLLQMKIKFDHFKLFFQFLKIDKRENIIFSFIKNAYELI